MIKVCARKKREREERDQKWFFEKSKETTERLAVIMDSPLMEIEPLVNMFSFLI